MNPLIYIKLFLVRGLTLVDGGIDDIPFAGAVVIAVVVETVTAPVATVQGGLAHVLPNLVRHITPDEHRTAPAEKGGIRGAEAKSISNLQ